MEDYEIVIKPLITEQSMHFANTKGAYSFQVNKGANKIQIRNAVEKLYKVKVKGVRTANRKGKPRRRGRFIGMTPSWKKAVVLLDKDYHIDLF
ncbi:MAG: 50S ribosomal protein L23 [Anaerohalosphaeraceae bacterium]|nr:50S ribosomal protein L23 [Anaerohalosphaeraceae bacterium]